MTNSIRIQIGSGYPLDTRKGNSVTAKRLATLFCQLGHQANPIHTKHPGESDALIALHAFNTFDASTHYRKFNPKGVLLVLLTGTDVHEQLEGRNHEVEQLSLIVDQFVVAHPEIIPFLPKLWQAKASVIYPSVLFPPTPEVVDPPIPKVDYFSCVGHLRPVKNPHLMFRALHHLSRPDIKTVSIGEALDQQEGVTATTHENIDPRYQWLRCLNHEMSIQWIKHSKAMINTSFSEGGANVIIESCLLGTPVLATRIPGNVGLLGSDYAGLFPPNDDLALAKLMNRCLSDSIFVAELTEQVRNRAKLFTNEQEAHNWLELIQKVLSQ